MSLYQVLLLDFTDEAVEAAPDLDDDTEFF